MKKTVALLLALALCLNTALALARQEAEVMTCEPSYEGTYVPFGDTGLSLYMPNDWRALETPDGALPAFSSPEAVIVMNATVETVTLEDMYERSMDSVQVGSAFYADINENRYLLVDVGDLDAYAAYMLDETTALVLAFKAAQPEIDNRVLFEILGSLTADTK